MAKDLSSYNNTPPRSPEHLEMVEDDIIEIIEFDDDAVDGFDDNDDYDDQEELMSEDDEVGAEENHIPPERNDAFATLTLHKQAVLACAFHPNLSHVVATGGMDNKVVIWDCSGAESQVLMDYTPEQNLESVDCVKFSPDGRFLASCDLNGNVHIFSCSDGYSYLDTVDQHLDFAGFIWHPSSKAFIVITIHTVTLVKIPSMESNLIIASPVGSISCGKLFPDGKRIVIGDHLGNVRVVDLKTNNVVSSCVIKSMEHDFNCVVYCMDVHMDGKSVICGSHMGLIANVNADTGKATYFPVSLQELLDVETIECGNKTALKNIVVSGHRSGHIKFWDLSRSALRCENKTDNPVTSMKWHPHTPHVFTGHADGKVLMSDVRDGSVVRDYLGHYPMILSIDISFDGNFLLSTSDDSTAKVYAITDEIPPNPPLLVASSTHSHEQIS